MHDRLAENAGEGLLQHRPGIALLSPRLFQHLQKALPVDGLEQIVLYPQLHGLLGVGKIRVSGKDDGLGLNPLLPQGGKHLHPVHLRHFHIGDNEIRPGFQNFLQADFSVLYGSYHLIFRSQTPQKQGNALPDSGLILHNHDSHSGSTSSSGSVMIISVPRSGPLFTETIPLLP